MSDIMTSPPWTAVATRGRVSDYLELCKLRLTSLVLFTTAVGFHVGYSGPTDGSFLLQLLHTILGTALVASGAMVLNQVMEREADGRMLRTRHRPIPSGRISPEEALRFGILLSVAGLLHLALLVHLLAALLALVTLGTYLFCYTPLKTRTPLCTLVGAVPGAIPPVIGYAAASGQIDLRAWTLFAILFVWQVPHFLAIAWLYREDYARGGQLMLPVLDPAGLRTSQQMVLYCLMLIPTAALPVWLGVAGIAYLTAGVGLGLGLLACALRLARRRTRPLARQAFIASVIYLPVLLGFMATDRL